jgi:hypothetical protein
VEYSPSLANLCGGVYEYARDKSERNFHPNVHNASMNLIVALLYPTKKQTGKDKNTNIPSKKCYLAS